MMLVFIGDAVAELGFGTEAELGDGGEIVSEDIRRGESESLRVLTLSTISP